MLLLISITIYISFDVTQTEEDKQKYNKDYIGLLQTIRGKQGQRVCELKDFYEFWADEIKSSTARNYVYNYYLGLHRPTIKGLYSNDKCDCCRL